MTTKKKRSTNAPTFIAYAVRDAAADQSYWTKIGVAFAHADGEGFNIQIEALPLDGKIVLRPRKERDDETDSR